MKLPPAFLTKITASIIALEKCNPTDKVTVSENVVKQVSGWKSAAAINLEAGEQISVLDLVYSMMLVSANDSLFALAEFICGGIDKFAVMMEEKADEAIMIAVKGMLPHNTQGANQLKRLRTYKGAEHKQAAQKPEVCEF